MNQPGTDRHDRRAVPSPGAARRRWIAAGVAVLGAVVVWAGAGAPWWAPVALIAGGLAGRLAGIVAPPRWRPWSGAVGAGAAGVWLAVQLSAAGQVFTAGVAVLVVVVAAPGARARSQRSPWWRLVAVVAAVALVVAGGIGAGVERLRDNQIRAQIDRQAGDYARAQLLPQSPGRAVRQLYAAVAQGDPAVCPEFSPAAAGQLAAAAGAAAGDCAGAIRLWHNQVRDPRRYQRPDRDSIAEQVSPDGQTGTATGCAASWTSAFAPAPAAGTGADTVPGPVLGAVHGERQLGQGYLLTAYQPCP